MFSTKNLEDAVDTIDYIFSEWTGGNDFGHRAFIGQFYVNIGEILILFNNDTGKIVSLLQRKTTKFLIGKAHIAVRL